MRIFEEIGVEVSKRWVDANLEERAFTEIAFDVLKFRSPAQAFDRAELMQWLFGRRELPVQLGLHSAFGEPPLTVFRAPGFVIDVYFWLDGSTSIHEHHFSGAFQVLDGSSLHCRYDWTPEERVNANLQFGRLALVEANVLEKGDCQRILPGREYIHSLFHLDRPSVTLVIRTVSNVDLGVQLDYRKPGLAMNPASRSEHTVRLLGAMRMLSELQDPSRFELARAYLATADLLSSYHVLEQAMWTEQSLDALGPLVDEARKRHGGRVEQMARTLEVALGQLRLVERRKKVHDPDLRLFLALLLNLEGRERILGFMKARLGARDVLATAARYVAQLVEDDLRETAAAVAGPEVPRILEHLLRGTEPQAVVERARRESNGLRPEDVRTLLDVVTGASFLRPLLGDLQRADAKAPSARKT